MIWLRAAYKGDWTIDELVLDTRAAAKFCDDVRHRRSWLYVPDERLLQMHNDSPEKPELTTTIPSDMPRLGWFFEAELIMDLPEFVQRLRVAIRLIVGAVIVISCGAAVDASWGVIVDLGKTRCPELEQLRLWPVFAMCRQLAEIGILIMSIPAAVCVFYSLTHPKSK